MSLTLKPCPFCGSADIALGRDEDVVWNQCRSCEATGPTMTKRQDDDEPDWNTRAEGRPSPEGEDGFSRAEFLQWYEWAREWSGSAFLADEPVSAEDASDLKGRLYSDLCRLGNHFSAWADLAALSTPSPEANVQRNRGKTNTSDEHVNDPDMSSPEAGREEDFDHTALGEPHTLAACPPGLFLAEAHGTLGMKTEYYTDKGAVEAYIVESGEFFWGDAPQTPERQRAQIVRPISHDAILQRLSNQQGGGS